MTAPETPGDRFRHWARAVIPHLLLHARRDAAARDAYADTTVCDTIYATFPNYLCNNSFRDTHYDEVYRATSNLIYINRFRCHRYIRLTLATASTIIGLSS